MTTERKHTICKGDRRTPVAAILEQEDADGTVAAVDLSGLSVAFRLVDNEGTTIVDDEVATVTSAAAGKVEYDFSAADMAAIVASDETVFWAWFIVTQSGETDTFPIGRYFRIEAKTAG